MKKLLKEFEEFINRGNVMDMAVGVIIGGAFTIVFALIKVVNKMHEIAGKAMHRDGNEDETPAPAPTCPYCLEEVHEGATKCCHCGSDLA